MREKTNIIMHNKGGFSMLGQVVVGDLKCENLHDKERKNNFKNLHKN